jgi:hypothetical protein
MENDTLFPIFIFFVDESKKLDCFVQIQSFHSLDNLSTTHKISFPHSSILIIFLHHSENFISTPGTVQNLTLAIGHNQEFHSGSNIGDARSPQAHISTQIRY